MFTVGDVGTEADVELAEAQVTMLPALNVCELQSHVSTLGFACARVIYV